MRSGSGHRLPLALALAVLFACTQQGPPPTQLAADQTLRAAINSDPRPGHTSLDPGHVSYVVETNIGENLFDGLYRVDDQLNLIPDIAAGMPDVSPDGLTYTFHLRHDVRFWNGEPVTARDVLYSWNRAAALGDTWAFSFGAVAGYSEVAAGSAQTMSGLSAADQYTVTVHLTEPTGYLLTELTLPTGWIVSQKAIEAGGELWWSDPNKLVGTGPLRMTSWVSNTEMDFAAVDNWWGGSTGALRRVELHIEPDSAARWQGYADGRYDILGFLRNDVALRDRSFVLTYMSDPQLRSEIHTWPFGTTSWLGFNLQTGPFSGYGDGAALRRAFSQAIDRTKLARDICMGGALCIKATGGLIAKGLQGYLGDGADPMARFDPTSARAAVKRLDPSGSKLRDLVFFYPLNANYDPTQAVAENLRSQWLANLGVDVTIRGLDQATFYTDALKGQFTMWRGGWQADYDHPEDWFDNLFLLHGGCEQGPCNDSGAVYDRPGYADLIHNANQESLQQALPAYKKAGQLLVDDAALGPLYYDASTVLFHAYIQGYGANGLNAYRWTSIRILQH